jgi:pyruvate dehydrogenase E2 component (dihydrolipoamide acetyltransferase)
MTGTEEGGISPLTVPRWGMAMEEGRVVSWLRNEGDPVDAGEEVLEMESSKIVNVLQAECPGVLRRKLAAEGETLPVGALLGIVSAPDVPDAAIDAFIAAYRPRATLPQRDARQDPAPAAPSGIPDALRRGDDDASVPASPHARRLARELGINLRNVPGSGRGGRVQIEDIEQAVRAAGGTLPGAKPADAAYEEIPLAGMRGTIARRLAAAKREAPHYRLEMEIGAAPLLRARGKLNRDRGQARVSVTDLLVKACAGALVKVPDCNIQFDGRIVRRFRHADIAVAVALDNGLITPIVRAADTKTATEISAELRDLARRARSDGLRPEEYEGGTFTVSNLGMFGVSRFDAVINLPQAAILAAGAVEPRVAARDGQVVIEERMTLTLSCDHRVIDGAVAARFMKALAQAIEDLDGGTEETGA